MTIRNLSEAEQILATYRPDVKEFLGKDITLDRMQPLMAALGNPQNNLKIVHIAGTSGKTSTAYYIAKMLQLTGSKVGLTVSPHVDSLLERVQLNGSPISETDFCRELATFLDTIASVDPRPTYFELLIAFVYSYFHKVGVDFAVIETGLGGLQDCTNIATNPDKLCIITDIGLDHTKVLGDTLPEIAAQKAGIIHQGNRAVMYRQSPEVMGVFTDWCDQVGATLDVVDSAIIDDFIFSPGLPLYQQRNWTLAWAAYQRLANQYNLPVIDRTLLEPSRVLPIAGHMEVITYAGQQLVLDGAHNTQKITAFVDSFQRLYPGVKPAILLSVRDRKDFTGLVEQLFPLASKLILTSFHVTQDIVHRNAHLDDMKQYCQEHGFDEVVIEPDQHQAFQNLLAEPGDVKVITGSFYLIHQLKSHEHLS